MKNKDIANHDRLFCYLWEENDRPNRCVFGQHLVRDGLDSWTECNRRIRNSMGTRKDIYDQGGVNVVAVWDVSDITNNKFHRSDVNIRAIFRNICEDITGIFQGEMIPFDSATAKIKIDAILDILKESFQQKTNLRNGRSLNDGV